MNARMFAILWDRVKSWVRAFNAALAVPQPLEGDGRETWRDDTVLQPRDL